MNIDEVIRILDNEIGQDKINFRSDSEFNKLRFSQRYAVLCLLKYVKVCLFTFDVHKLVNEVEEVNRG